MRIFVSTIVLLVSLFCLVGARLSATTEDEEKHRLVQMPLIPHATVLERRRRRRQRRNLEGESDSDLHSDRSSVLYQGFGTHYVDLWIGTPSQRQTVIVDTGSSITAIPCSECTNCGAAPAYHMDSLFAEDRSSSFTTIQECNACSLGGICDTQTYNTTRCIKRGTYAEGSGWSAKEVVDRVYLGGPSHETALDDSLPNDVFNLQFGCQTQLTGLFLTQLADGIMGMDKTDANTSPVSRTFWKQAFDQKAIDDRAFSLCFSGTAPTSMAEIENGASAGVLTLGGTNTKLHQTTMVYAADQTNRYPRLAEFYTVRLQKMYLRSTTAQVQPVTIDEDALNAGGVIVDSGTTMSELPAALAKPFQDAYKAVTGRDWFFNNKNDQNQEIAITNEQFNALPTILLQIEGQNKNSNITGAEESLATTLDATSPNSILVAIPPAHYLELVKQEGDTYFYASLLNFNINTQRNAILGANFMMGYDILFDITNQRLGFAESNCDYQTISNLETSG